MSALNPGILFPHVLFVKQLARTFGYLWVLELTLILKIMAATI